MISIPHRGRLALLTGMLDYPAKALFSKVWLLTLLNNRLAIIRNFQLYLNNK